MVFYTCKRCGKKLFEEDAVLHAGQHDRRETADGVSRVKAPWVMSLNSGHKLIEQGTGDACSSVFITDKPDWMTDTESNGGRIDCPKCASRVGSYKWSGVTCSCGKWITPAFQFQLSRVDAKNVLEALEGIKTDAGGRTPQALTSSQGSLVPESCNQ